METTPRAPCLYCRLSYAPDGSLEKVERQEADGRLLGSRLGWPDFCCVYVDNSRSAWQRNRVRPDWDRMLLTLDATGARLVPHDPKANHVHDGIMTYHGDRLIRQPYDLELLLNLADQRHVPLASVSGVRNLASPDDRFILRIEAAQACRESDNISRRTRRGHLARAQKKGLNVQGGKRPFAFGVPTGRTRIKTDPQTGGETRVEILDYNKVRAGEAKYAADAAERLLAGQSAAGVIRWLNEDVKVTTTEGNPWSTRTLWGMLLSPRMAGLIERDGVLYEASWDAILPEETRQDLIALHERNREETPNPGPARKHLLSGILECGECGSKESRTKPYGGKGRKYPSKVYYCRSCYRFARSIEMLDAYVEGRTLRVLRSRSFLAELKARTEAGSPRIGEQIAELERRKADLAQRIENAADDPDLDPVLAMKSVAGFDRKITELRGQLAMTAELRLLTRMAGIDRAAWAAAPVDTRSATIRALFRIVVSPTARRGPGFDPASVTITRRLLVKQE
ncbi:recombinase family protein [Streptomyces synnematoformans]|uniref:Recombinase family protein n=1 Tax=Streptomyces synnematoformans TaxID=415721 RepID=A0ABN2XAM7_9ACTN